MTGRLNWFAGLAVVQHHLARAVETRRLQHVLDVVDVGAVEHRGRDRNTLGEVLAELDHLLVRVRQHLVGTIDGAKAVGERLLLAPIALPRLQQVADLAAEAGAGPAEVGLEDLADVHPRRHAQRIEHDVDRGAVFQVRHVLDRQDLGDDALVAVTAGHLVAGLQLALNRDEDLDHLHHAGRQLVAALQLVDLVLEARVETLAGVVEQAAHGFQLAHRLLVVDGDLPPQAGLDLGQLLLGDLAAAETLGSRTAVLPISSSRNREVMLRFRIANSSSRSLPRRSISSRSMAMARSSLSTP